MHGKMLAVMAQIGAAVAAWWITRTEDERREIHAKGWRELEKLAMNLAKHSSNLAAYSERRYKDVVSGVM